MVKYHFLPVFWLINDVNGHSEALFHFLDKSLLLKHLRELKPDKTVNRKAFYKSYVKWEDLNQTQRNKTIIFWVTNLTDGVRFALKQCVEADAANESAEEANRLSITNKHDKARLLHLRIDPSAAVQWSEALREKSRVQLDDRDGQGGYVCPFDSLASLFNDPTNVYENSFELLPSLVENVMPTKLPHPPQQAALTARLGRMTSFDAPM